MSNDQDDRNADEVWRSIVAELALTDDELARGLERATVRQRPDTDWRPLPRLPISDECCDPPGGAWWRRRADIMFTIVEAQTGVGLAVGLTTGGWVSTANGIPIVSVECPAGFLNEDEAKAFCDELDAATLGDFQI